MTFGERIGRLPRCRLPRCRLPLGLLTILFVAGCSGIGDDGENNGAEPTVGQESVDETIGTADDEADPEAPVSEPTVEEIVDIWRRADDTVFQPDESSSTYEEVMAPGDEADGWRIVGSIRDHTTSRATAAVWRSDQLDPNKWERIDVSPVEADVDEVMRDIARFGDLLVTVGSRGSGPERHPAFWFSDADGSWQVAESPAADETQNSGAGEWVHLLSVSPAGDRILAMGARTASDGQIHTVFWVSEDGRNWDRLDSDQLDPAQQSRPTSVAVGPNGIVGVGSITGDELQSFGRVWLSPDGESWTAIEPESMATGYRIRVNSIDRLDDQLVVVGSVREANDNARPASWTSIDGETWEGPFLSWDLADDGRTSSIGFEASRVVSAGDRVLATADSDFLQHVWSSDDGRNWQVVDNIRDVRGSGIDIRGIAADGSAVMTATDGPSVMFHDGEWGEIRLDKNTTPSPSNSPYVNDIAWTPDGFVAVGGFEAKPGAATFELTAGSWISSDGETWEEFLSSGRRQMGPFGSVAAVDGEPYTTLTETVEHSGTGPGLGTGLALRPADSTWAAFYEFETSGSRSAVTHIAQANDTLVVGGWQFSVVEGRSDARLGEVLLDGIGDRATAQLELASPPAWNGAGDHIDALCVANDGTALAVAQGRTETGGGAMLVIRRATDGTWTEETAADDSLAGNESQFARACVGGPDETIIAGWINNGGDGDAAVWSATGDGQWQQATSDVFTGVGVQWVGDAVAVGSRFLLAGGDSRSGIEQATLWIGQGSEWSAIPVGSEAWRLQGFRIETDAADRAEADIGNATVVVTGWQDGRTVAYHTTLSEIDGAVEALAELESE